MAFVSLIYIKVSLKPYEIIIPFIFVILLLLLHFFMLENLQNFEKSLFIMYFLGIYYTIFDKINRIYSLISINFLIIFTSFQTMNLINHPLNLLCNFFFIIFQILNLFIPKHKQKKQKLSPTSYQNENELLEHLFDDAFPGLVFLFKRKECKKDQIIYFEKDQQLIDLCFINQKAKSNYNLKNYKDFVDFLEEIVYLKEGNKKGETLKNFKDDILKQLNEFDDLSSEKTIERNLDKNHQFLLDNHHFIGYYPKKQMKLKLFITGVMRNNSVEIILFIDDNQFEEHYFSLKELAEKKDKMLISITHDLRSPLNGILAFINLAKNEDNIENRNKKLYLAEINGNLLMSLIEDILDFQSISQNKFNLKAEEFSLNQVLEEIIDLVSIQAKEKNIHFQLNNHVSDKNISIFSDSRRLRQILLNLLTNSIKFTLNGGKLRMNVYETRVSNIVKFEIIDSGIGIKPEIIEKLGEPFNSFDTNGLNKYGIGFGLYLCKKLSSLIGPSERNFHISSIYGKGCKIGFLIYKRLSENESKTLSLKKLFCQISENYSTKPANPVLELEKIKKISMKINLDSRTEIWKKTFFKKQAISLLDFEMRSINIMNSEANNIEERKNCDKAQRYKTEIGRKPIDKFNEKSDKFNEKVLKSSSYIKGETNFQEISLKKSISQQVNGSSSLASLQSKILKMKIMTNESLPSKKEINIGEESLQFTQFSEDDFREDEFDEDGLLEKIDEECIGSRSLKKYCFLPKLWELKKPLFLQKSNNFEKETKNFSSELFSIKEKKLKLGFPMLESFETPFLQSLTTQTPQKCNVLIVDDNPFILLILCEFLKKIPGFVVNIEKASNGADCLEIFKNLNKKKNVNNLDIVFMDCFMPILDGYEASSEIKKLVNEEKYVDAFIIAVTGLNGFEEENKCKEFGMDDFIMKPVSEKELREVFLFYMTDYKIEEGE